MEKPKYWNVNYEIMKLSFDEKLITIVSIISHEFIIAAVLIIMNTP